MYEKTNAEMEMKKINREEFWEQAKVSKGRVTALSAVVMHSVGRGR